MSIQYQKELFSKDSIKLYINFSGISPENCINKEDLSLIIYAFDTKNFQQIFSEKLEYEQILDLFNQLNSLSIIRDNSSTFTNEFIEVTKELQEILPFIKSVDSTIIKAILDKARKGNKLNLIIDALSDIEIKDLNASINQAIHEKSLTNLKLLLELESTTNILESIHDFEDLNEYLAGQPEKIFQNWIEKNIWTLGIDYIRKHPAHKIGISSDSDLIMETTDGFIDLIELKRPKFEIFSYDESHRSYYPSKELSKVIGQCMQYLKILDNYKLVLESEYKYKILRPRIKIIVGRSIDFDDDRNEALRMLNSCLNHIQVISYDYLYQSGKNIISYYKGSD
ncbi:MAG: hypothetical protein A2X61_06975 [Ignavibacteria bacterium GWB2_35_12]|nr:MAG: hypothetical protein A2X61_06975 [Ignavibacteria bacterium GWB2_35_12]OGU93843.1 MAG: hypothetical protein A2220_11840 [Ignavibacteria bacterium RIFOXYA2_FULL_35_10]OGV22051.1 MAG: hypothetical protein A2475_09475 [Ignavibacteria bacterium RIFOXYC2_FULL_35_21]